MLTVAHACAAAMACASALIAQQRTLVVDRINGPYTEITQAVAAAQPGDRIEVHATPALYYYGAVTLSSGIDIDAAPGSLVLRVVVQNLPASQSVRIQGLTIDTTFDQAPRLQILNCQGPVHVHEVTVSGGSVITGSPAVALSSCSMNGDVNIGPGTNFTTAVQVTGANVALHACTIRGGFGNTLAPAAYAGITMSGGQVTLSACQVVGGRGRDGILPCTGLAAPSNGGPGVGGSGLVTACNGGSVAGGPGGSGACPTTDGPPFSGITARVAPSVVLTGGGGPLQGIVEPPSLSMPAIAFRRWGGRLAFVARWSFHRRWLNGMT
jgi:hypothetical protein